MNESKSFLENVFKSLKHENRVTGNNILRSKAFLLKSHQVYTTKQTKVSCSLNTFSSCLQFLKTRLSHFSNQNRVRVLVMKMSAILSEYVG